MQYKELSPITFLAIFLPSGIAYTCTGISLLGIYPSIRSAVIMGALVAITTMCTKIFNVPSGVHTIIICFSLSLFFVRLEALSFRTAFLASLISTAIVFMGNNLFIMPVLSMLGITVEESVKLMKYHIIMAWASEILPLAAVAILSKHFNFILLKAPESSKSTID